MTKPKKDLKDKDIKKIEEFFKNYHISGIINVPEVGTFSVFDSTGTKLKILEHAKIEIVHREILIEKEARAKFDELDNFSKIKIKRQPSYLG